MFGEVGKVRPGKLNLLVSVAPSPTKNKGEVGRENRLDHGANSNRYDSNTGKNRILLPLVLSSRMALSVILRQPSMA